MTRITKENKGLTLVELVIIIAIMMILTAVISPLVLRQLENSRVKVDEQKLASIRLGTLIAIQDKDDEELPIGKSLNMAALDDSLRTEISMYTGVNFDHSLSKIFKSRAAKAAEAIYVHIAPETRNVTVWLGNMDGIPTATGFDNKFYADGDAEVANGGKTVTSPKAYTYVELMAMSDEEVANLPIEVKKATDLETGKRIYDAAMKVIDANVKNSAAVKKADTTPIKPGTENGVWDYLPDGTELYIIARTIGVNDEKDVTRYSYKSEISYFVTDNKYASFRDQLNQELGTYDAVGSNKNTHYVNNDKTAKQTLTESGMNLTPITTNNTEVYRWFVVRNVKTDRVEVWVGSHGTNTGKGTGRRAARPLYRVYPDPDPEYVVD
jgi:hypothetical protein